MLVVSVTCDGGEEGGIEGDLGGRRGMDEHVSGSGERER